MAGAAVAETFPGPFPVRLVRIIDGDTIRVEIRLWFSQVLTETVRIAGIDAPERGKKARCRSEAEGAERAAARLSELLTAGHLELLDVRREKYGRALATVRVGGVDVGQTLVREGLARTYQGGRRLSWCG